MNYFDKFPKGKDCPICGTDKDGACFLMPIDGTEDGNICEAAPTHKECVGDSLPDKLRYNSSVGVIYLRSVPS